MPYTGRRVLGRDGSDVWYVVDEVTLRRQNLPRGAREIVEDELGWAVFQNVDAEVEGDQPCLIAEDFVERLSWNNQQRRANHRGSGRAAQAGSLELG